MLGSNNTICVFGCAIASPEQLPQRGYFHAGCHAGRNCRGFGGIRSNSGTSDDLLMPLILVQLNMGKPNREPLLNEVLDGREKVSVTWPESISLYKRGELDDTQMDFALNVGPNFARHNEISRGARMRGRPAILLDNCP